MDQNEQQLIAAAKKNPKAIEKISYSHQLL